MQEFGTVSATQRLPSLVSLDKNKPNRFGVTTDTSSGGGFEVGVSMGFEVITRGKDAGVF